MANCDPWPVEEIGGIVCQLHRFCNETRVLSNYKVEVWVENT
jgi:hypothetical protein